MNDSPYVSAAKYAFMIIGGGALAAALVKGTFKVLTKGFRFIGRESEKTVEPVEATPDASDTPTV